MGRLSVLDDMGFAEIAGALTVGQCAEVARAVDTAEVDRVSSRNLLDLACCQDLAAARTPSRRRVLHFLFGTPELTCGLRWHRAV